jgi:tRNA nucleotidyltransferase/poly(A) polymerase
MIIQFPDPVRKVMQALQESNAEVYLAGGAVRDSLINISPKDYEIATTAGEYKISEIARSAGWRFISNLGHNLGTCTDYKVAWLK